VKELLQEMEQAIAKSVYECTATDLVQFLRTDRTGVVDVIVGRCVDAHPMEDVHFVG
jgi:hypothetical protein